MVTETMLFKKTLKGNHSMFECFHCGKKAVVWQSDFDFSDYGYDGEGIVQVLHCSNCGAEIEYKIPLKENENEQKETSIN